MRYARLLYCIVWDGIERSRSTAAWEMKGVCVFMRETNIASTSVCVYVLFANAKASSVPPSCLCGYPGCDMYWMWHRRCSILDRLRTAERVCTSVRARVCKRWQGRRYLQSPTMPANYSNKALHLYLPTATSCLSFLSPVSLLGAALPFPSPPLLLSSPPVSPSLPLSPYGTHYKRCRFSPPTFLRAFHHSLTLHQPCAPLSLFTLFFIVSLSFVISLLVFFLTFQYPVTLFYFLTCR